MAAPQLTGSLLRIPFGAWVDKVGGRLPMLTLFGISIVGMWGLVFILLTAKTLTVSAFPIILLFGFMSGCGVASFSVGIPQVSYWYPQPARARRSASMAASATSRPVCSR